MYRESNILEKLLSLLFIPVYLLWKLLVVAASLLWRLVCDVAKNVYGRSVVAIGAVIFAALVLYANNFFR